MRQAEVRGVQMQPKECPGLTDTSSWEEAEKSLPNTGSTVLPTPQFQASDL